MNKTAIKKFAIEARKKLMASVVDRAGFLGITQEECREPMSTGTGFAVFQTTAGTETTLYGDEIKYRQQLVNEIKLRGFEAVVEEVAYTWFNRIIAIRFMEVNDYLPTRVRVLSSEKIGKVEPDLLTLAPDVDMEFTEQEREYILTAKSDNKLDELFRMLFIKQCQELHKILPELFEKTNDYTEMLLNISFTNKYDVVRMLVDEVEEENFDLNARDEEGNQIGQVEIIGWLYQYYNTELKDDTFAKLKKNIKITKERIPAATQLFTPDWIVRYMVENSLGRLWIEHLRANDETVDEKETAERFGWKYYLPEAEQEEQVNIQLAEVRTSYKDLKPTDILCIDPCMGSGHILIYMFDVLMDIYKSVGYSERDAAFEIVEHNIHGLDIDKRAYQLAYFAVMMKGRGYNRRFFKGVEISVMGRKSIKYPKPLLCAIRESNVLSESIAQQLQENFGNTFTNEDIECIKYVHQVFKDAREYGSILNIDENRGYEHLKIILNQLENGTHEYCVQNNLNIVQRLLIKEVALILNSLLFQAKIMRIEYDVIVTNPPYMGNGGFTEKLTNYSKDNYPNSKNDLYSIMIDKSIKMLSKKGFLGMITMQSWINAPTFKQFRKSLFQNNRFVIINNLGTRAFDEISGEKVKTTTFIISKSRVKSWVPTFVDLTDISGEENKKIAYLKFDRLYSYAKQDDFNLNDSCLVIYKTKHVNEIYHSINILGDFADVKRCIATGNDELFIRNWYEVNKENICCLDKLEAKKWYFIANGGNYHKWYGNINCIIDWENDGTRIKQFHDKTKKSTLRNTSYLFSNGITYTYTSMGSGKFNARIIHPTMLSIGVGPIITNMKNDNYIFAYVNSKVFLWFIDIMFGKVSTFETGNISSIPCKMNSVEDIDRLVTKCVEISKNDWDSYELSYDFKENQLISEAYNNSYIKNLVDKNNDKIESNFIELKKAEESINEIFINMYGLEDELKKTVNDEEITLRRVDVKRDIKELISYLVGCMLGRYSLKTRNNVYTKEVFENCIVKDNILLITDESYFEDDIVNRFIELIKNLFGSKSLEENLEYISSKLENKGNNSREIIRNYFVKDFYKDHCKMYRKAPIYWMFESGKENAFKALIYMHKYDTNTVGKVRVDYLHRVQSAIESGIESSKYVINNTNSTVEKSRASKQLTKLTKQLAETRLYDQALVHIANEQLKIDLDDGVKVNYAKFQNVVLYNEGKKAVKIDLLGKKDG